VTVGQHPLRPGARQQARSCRTDGAERRSELDAVRVSRRPGTFRLEAVLVDPVGERSLHLLVHEPATLHVVSVDRNPAEPGRAYPHADHGACPLADASRALEHGDPLPRRGETLERARALVPSEGLVGRDWQRAAALDDFEWRRHRAGLLLNSRRSPRCGGSPHCGGSPAWSIRAPGTRCRPSRPVRPRAGSRLGRRAAGERGAGPRRMGGTLHRAPERQVCRATGAGAKAGPSGRRRLVGKRRVRVCAVGVSRRGACR